MSTTTIQPDLIISLSQDRVRLSLSENSSLGRSGWQASFKVDSLFLEDQISRSLDSALLENPTLMEEFSCVEIIILDRPNICVSKHYADQGKLGEIASRYLRLRTGDSLATDPSENDALICYTVPTETLTMLKEYYADIGCHHFSTLLWNHFLTQLARPSHDETRLYLTLTGDLLIILAEKNNKLIFSKNFEIKEIGDLYYYSIACSRMLNASENWLVMIEEEEEKYEMPGDSILKIEKRLRLPSLDVLMVQYKVCVS
ncbi:MAG TPA: DUF3822 family protein [Saprospiraceae bacterium]|nr:DUF3822 family protein [Saprospiraceae bacterium]